MILSTLFLTFLASDLYAQARRPMTPGEAARMYEQYSRERWQRQMDGVTQRYNDALTREEAAHRQAEYAERHFPNSPIARSYRQTANGASWERARAELAYKMTRDKRGPGVNSYESHQTDDYNRFYDKVRPDRSPQSRKGDLPFSRNSDTRREPSDQGGRTVSGYGYGGTVKGKIQDRLAPSGDNNRSGNKEWADRQRERADRQREWADRRP